MRKLLIPVLTLLLLVALLPHQAKAYLSDIVGHWSASMVGALEARGTVSGNEQGLFLPDASLTRAQLAKLLTTGLGFENDATELGKYPSRYPDVPVWHWARGYIEVFAELGLTNGYSDGRFGPEETVTRAQLATFAVRALGLAERARLSSNEPTVYEDDADVPGWARGAIYVAYREGIMVGLPDGRFYPNRTVTRAEGLATIYRVMARTGTLHNLSGTLVRLSPLEGTGAVRDALGQERTFRIAPSASYMRQGSPVTAGEIRVADQVFIVFGSSGDAVFMEARYEDLLAKSISVTGGGVLLALPTGETTLRQTQPGAIVLVNGRETTLEHLAGVTPVYLAFDQTTGAVRLMAGTKADMEGLFAGTDSVTGEALIIVNYQEKRLSLAPDAIFISDGERVAIEHFVPGDEVALALDTEGRLTYMEATR